MDDMIKAGNDHEDVVIVIHIVSPRIRLISTALRSKKSASSVQGGFSTHETTPPTTLGDVNPHLVTVQAIPQESEKDIIQNGKQSLYRLEKWRADALCTRTSKDELLKIKGQIEKTHEAPEPLQKILNEIHTRVSVEIAKRR